MRERAADLAKLQDIYQSAGSFASSMAAITSSPTFVTPSEAALTIRCAIFAFVPGVR